MRLTAKISFTVLIFLDMATSYSGFTSVDDIQSLGLLIKRQKLFADITFAEPSEVLKSILKMNTQLPLGNEKAKSEMLVAPILSEIWSRNQESCMLFSGYELSVNKEQGLTGRCDFLFSAIDNIIVEAPIIAIVEAKNDNVDDAVPQCIAQLFASQIFNEQKGRPTPVLYGATTTGFEWLFMRLRGSTVELDRDLYQLRSLSELLGVLQHIINVYKELPLSPNSA